RVMRGVERGIYRDTRVAGVVHAAAGVGLGVVVGAAVRSTALATCVCAAGRGLASAAGEVGRALDDGNLDRARSLLPALVGRAPAVWRAVRDQAPAHPSPNAGVAEAAFAAALGLRLGGENRYAQPVGCGGTTTRVELRPPLGVGRPPERADIARAVVLSRDVTV